MNIHVCGMQIVVSILHIYRQLQFERDPDSVKCLVYREDAVSKTHDGGIEDRSQIAKRSGFTPMMTTLIDVVLGLLKSICHSAHCITRKRTFTFKV